MSTDINYTRVIPRDLFNESKLLKCVGRLILLAHDRQVENITYNEPQRFDIGLMEEGSLTVASLEICIKGEPHIFKTTYNSKSAYPFYCQTPDLEDIPVFNDNGEVSEEFKQYITV